MLSYCADLVKRHRRDDFLQSLFVPAEVREAMLALYALNAELSQVREKTGEEVIAQVRLAWWQEAVSAIYDGHPPREQPVLQALAPVTGHVPQEMLIGLIERYREDLAGFYTPPPIGGRLGGGRIETPSIQSLHPSKVKKQHPDVVSSTFEPPPMGEGIDGALEQISLHLLRAISPQSEPGWRKAKSTIAKHRKRYGDGRNGWLSFKLLVAGI